MPQLLKHMRNSIVLNEPASFRKLVDLGSNAIYCDLANDMESKIKTNFVLFKSLIVTTGKCAELKQNYNGDDRSTAACLNQWHSHRKSNLGIKLYFLAHFNYYL